MNKDRAISRNTYLRGFTLLEILVSTIILVLVTTGLAYVFVAGRRHIRHTRSKIQTAELGRLFLEPLWMDVRQDQWVASGNCLTGDGSSGCPGFQEIDGIRYTPTYQISPLLTDAQNPLGRLRKVRLTINWTEPSP